MLRFLLDNFDAHLMNDPVIKPGDDIVFSYDMLWQSPSLSAAGWPEIEKWTRRDGSIMTICPYDERTHRATTTDTWITDQTFKTQHSD